MIGRRRTATIAPPASLWMLKPRKEMGNMKGNRASTNWTHSAFGGMVPMLSRNDKGQTTRCGKTAKRIRATTNNNSVTCPRCIEVLKENEWHCEKHGFLEPEDVTFEETCDYCGEPVGQQETC